MTEVNAEVRAKIERAAEDLYAETGKVPAATEVRARAGGAMNIVGQVVREWKAKLRSQEEQVSRTQPPWRFTA